MKWFGKFLAVLLAVSVPAALSAASDRTAFAKIKVEFHLEQPPVPNVSRAPNSNPWVTLGQKWLVVKVLYSPQTPRDGGPVRSTFLDGVRMRVTSTFPIGGDSRSGELGLFKGEETFWTVCCDGRQHTAMMFVPPHLLQRYVYMADGYSGVHTPQRGSIKVEVVFTDSAGTPLRT